MDRGDTIMAELTDKTESADPRSEFAKGHEAGYRQGFQDARSLTLITIMNALFSSEALIDG